MNKVLNIVFFGLIFLFTNQSYADTVKSKYCPPVETLRITEVKDSSNKSFFTVTAVNQEGKLFISYPLSHRPAPVLFLPRETNYYPENKVLECGYYAYQPGNIYVYLHNKGDY